MENAIPRISKQDYALMNYRLIEARDRDRIFELLESQTTVMDQELDKELKHIVSMSLSNFTQWLDDPYSQTMVYEDDEGLVRAVLFAKFNIYINAWKIDLILSDLKSFSGGKITAMLISKMIDYAESRGFYHYYYVRAFDKLMMDKSWDRDDSGKFLWSRYEKGVDEIVKANCRPVCGVYWDWLFSSKCKPVDTAVVHRFLPDQYRQFRLE